MEKITVGIDVSKDHLDVAVRPSGALFAVPRTGAGLDGFDRRCPAAIEPSNQSLRSDAFFAEKFA